MRTPEQTFGDALRAARRQNSLSQDAVADQMRARGFDSFDQSKVSRVEHGAGPLRVNEAVAVARIVGADLLEMFITAISDEVASDGRAAARAERLAYARMINVYGRLIDAKVRQNQVEDEVADVTDEYQRAEFDWQQARQRMNQINNEDEEQGQ